MADLPKLPEPLQRMAPGLHKGQLVMFPNEEVGKYVRASDALKYADRVRIETIQEIAKFVEKKTLRQRSIRGFANAAPTAPCEIAMAIRAILDKEQQS